MPQLTYDIELSATVPKKGQYLVTIGKKGVGTVYFITSVRLVKAKVVREYNRFSLTVVSKPELKPLTEFEMLPKICSANVWVRGEEALPCFWHPRGKK